MSKIVMQRHRRANVEKKGLEPFGEPSIKTLVSLILKTAAAVQEERGEQINFTFSTRKSFFSSRKEVFQPHLPVRLPCYDLAPITDFALGRSLRSRTSGTLGFHGLTGGVYKARERIHRAMADARLLANPASWGDRTCARPTLCTGHCNTCVAPDVRAVLI